MKSENQEYIHFYDEFHFRKAWMPLPMFVDCNQFINNLKLIYATSLGHLISPF